MGDSQSENGLRHLSRRRLLAAAGTGTIAMLAARPALAATTPPPPPRPSTRPSSRPSSRPDFHGRHQQGVITPPQRHLAFTSLDVTTRNRSDLAALLRTWSVAGATLASGRLPSQLAAGHSVDASELAASNLTITIGLGPSLFTDGAGRDRFGLARMRPAQFTELPAFANDELVPGLSGGDLCLQVCADSERVVGQAVRTLLRSSRGNARPRWSQAGFTGSGQGAPAGTPRNLFGFKDGTANIAADDVARHAKYVWAQPQDGPEWMTGGTYLAARRIQMKVHNWDDHDLAEQEAAVGRSKTTGAPLSGGDEFTPPDLTATTSTGRPAIAPDSHVALAHPARNDGQLILRRGYNFLEGTDQAGNLVGGLFFMTFVRDLERQFNPMMHSLAGADRLNEYLTYQSSSAFAVPPGASVGGYVGETLLEA